MKLDIIAGARPNFMKIAPIVEELQKVKDKIEYRLIHTGQHYDRKRSGSFFKELGIPDSDGNLKKFHICGMGITERIVKNLLTL
jgi:UDP-N-acetylglucosamine 2-epimerase (non-hydrolysing)